MQLVRRAAGRAAAGHPDHHAGQLGYRRRRSRETPGQIVYPWVEAMPASMYSTWWAAGAGPASGAGATSSGGPSSGAELVYFHGFDNTYHWGLMDLVLLMAHGDRYVLPERNVCNEFYELDGAKFSTSRNHLIRGAELLDRGAPRPGPVLPGADRAGAPADQLHPAGAGRGHRARGWCEPWNALADAVSLLAHGRSGQHAADHRRPAGHRAALVLARICATATSWPASALPGRPRRSPTSWRRLRAAGRGRHGRARRPAAAGAHPAGLAPRRS